MEEKDNGLRVNKSLSVILIFETIEFSDPPTFRAQYSLLQLLGHLFCPDESRVGDLLQIHSTNNGFSFDEWTEKSRGIRNRLCEVDLS